MKNKLEPLSRELLLAQGMCCGRGCLNCPYDYESIPEPHRTKIQIRRKQWEISQSSKTTSNQCKS